MPVLSKKDDVARERSSYISSRYWMYERAAKSARTFNDTKPSKEKNKLKIPPDDVSYGPEYYANFKVEDLLDFNDDDLSFDEGNTDGNRKCSGIKRFGNMMRCLTRGIQNSFCVKQDMRRRRSRENLSELGDEYDTFTCYIE